MRDLKPVPQSTFDSLKMPSVELRPAVQRLLAYKATYPKDVTPWRIFTSVEDWVQYHSLQSAWVGKNISELALDVDHGGSPFVQTFRHWVREQAQGKRDRAITLIKRVFPSYNPQERVWDLGTIEEWQAELKNHPEWSALTYAEMKRDRKGGGELFIRSFHRWLRERSGDENESRITLIRSLWPEYEPIRPKADFSKTASLDQWKEVFASHAEFQGLTLSQVVRLNDGMYAPMVAAFRRFAKDHSQGDQLKFTEIIKSIFPSYKLPQKRSTLKTVNDWKNELMRHPDWQNKSMSALKRENGAEAAAFVSSFTVWARRQAHGSSERYDELIMTLFPTYVVMQDYSGLTTTAAWRSAIAQRSGWAGKSMVELRREFGSNANSFLERFRNWVRSESGGSKVRYDELVQEVFPGHRSVRSYSNLTTVLDWRNRLANILARMPLDVSSAPLTKIQDAELRSLIATFRDWAKNEAKGDRVLERSFRCLLLPLAFMPRDEYWFRIPNSSSLWSSVPNPLTLKSHTFVVNLDDRQITFHRRFVYRQDCEAVEALWAVRVSDVDSVLQYIEPVLRTGRKRVRSLGNTYLLSSLDD